MRQRGAGVVRSEAELRVIVVFHSLYGCHGALEAALPEPGATAIRVLSASSIET